MQNSMKSGKGKEDNLNIHTTNEKTGISCRRNFK